MIKYIEISNPDYYDLKDKSGYYCINFPNGGTIAYLKDYKYHNEYGPSIIYSDGSKYYYLNNEFYGNQLDYTDETWIRFCKLRAFI